MIGGVAIMIKSGLSYSITDLSSNIEAIIVNMYVPPTSEFIAENYKDLISKPSSLIVGDLNAYSPLWGKTRLIKNSLSIGLGQPWPCLVPFSVIGPSLWNRLPLFSSYFFLIFQSF